MEELYKACTADGTLDAILGNAGAPLANSIGLMASAAGVGEPTFQPFFKEKSLERLEDRENERLESFPSSCYTESNALGHPCDAQSPIQLQRQFYQDGFYDGELLLIKDSNAIQLEVDIKKAGTSTWIEGDYSSLSSVVVLASDVAKEMTIIPGDNMLSSNTFLANTSTWMRNCSSSSPLIVVTAAANCGVPEMKVVASDDIIINSKGTTRKRGRKMNKSPTNLDDMIQTRSSKEEERKLRRKESNRRAAEKYRTKLKTSANDAVSEHERLTEENKSLRETLEEYKHHLSKLHSAIEQHRSICSVSMTIPPQPVGFHDDQQLVGYHDNHQRIRCKTTSKTMTCRKR